MNTPHVKPAASPASRTSAKCAEMVPGRWAAAVSPGDLSPLWRLLVERGSREVVVPGMSALDHALCVASLAQEAGAGTELIAASLLHDIGHLLREDFCVSSLPGGRDRHAMIGAAFLSLWFGPAVTESVRLHGEAKRYLCSSEPGYAARLHAGARSSLTRNGGPMSSDEARAFLGGPHGRQAILLLRWDDRSSAERIKPCAIGRFRRLAENCRI